MTPAELYQSMEVTCGELAANDIGVHGHCVLCKCVQKGFYTYFALILMLAVDGCACRIIAEICLALVRL